MASIEQCESALHSLAEQLAANADARKKADLDRSLSCSITDLGVVFGARLRNGSLQDIHQVEDAGAQVRLSTSSDDLVAMVDGELSMAKAWAAGRVKIEASIFDLLRLKSVF
jgi:alkyl sulfatase BDS1-like metallo-beta-lactamase superfamily hydrolase